MVKFNRPPAQDEKVAVNFKYMIKRFIENKEANAKYLLDKIKKMNYNSKVRNKDNLDKHQANEELYNQWREFIRGDMGVGFGYDYNSQFRDG